MTEPRLCRRCGQAVLVSADSYDVFEGMHWLCFHLEFEHEGDPDRACSDPGCPWWHIDVYRERLRQLGQDPDAVLRDAIGQRWRR